MARKNWIGRFDNPHNPVLDFNLYSYREQGKKYRVTGVIDTGFTGFIQIPLEFASFLGAMARPAITTTVRLANNALQNGFLVNMTAEVEGECRNDLCLVSLVKGSQTLIGMEFLRLFSRALIILQQGNRILLMPDESFPTVSDS